MSSKEVIVTTKIEKQIVDKLKKNAREKDYRFSAYVKRILTEEAERSQKEKQN